MEPYAQVRLIGKIKSVGEKKEDPVTGKMYTRVLIGQSNVKDCLKYGEEGNKMLDSAILRANTKYGFININQRGQVI